MEIAHSNHDNQTAERLEQRRIRHVHHHPSVKNINQVAADQLTTGDRIADGFAAMMGSWTFIITQSIILTFWIGVNIAAWVNHWDPYPFILLNLALSFQAAYAAPIIMMSQNRQSAKDRLMAEQDYEINAKAEEEVKAIMHHLEQQDEFMITILRRLEDNQQLLLAAHKLLDAHTGSNSSD